MTPLEQRGAILVALEPFHLPGEQAEHVAQAIAWNKQPISNSVIAHTNLPAHACLVAIMAIERLLRAEPVRKEAS